LTVADELYVYDAKEQSSFFIFSGSTYKLTAGGSQTTFTSQRGFVGKRLGGTGQDFSLGSCDSSETPAAQYLNVAVNFIDQDLTTTASVALSS